MINIADCGPSSICIYTPNYIEIIYTNLIGYNAIIEIIARGGAEGKLF